MVTNTRDNDLEIERLNREVEALRQTRDRLVQKLQLLQLEATAFAKPYSPTTQLKLAIEGAQREIIAAYPVVAVAVQS